MSSKDSITSKDRTKELHKLVNVEDAIFTRLVEAEELLIVATGLFTELSEDKGNWLFNHQSAIADARWALRNVIDDRKF